MVGIFAGALTSTPAFSAAKASAKDEFESAVTVGYGLAYIFGVLGVVIFVQIVPKISNADMDIERDLILGGDYKIAKRVGTERTEQTERSKIFRSLSGEFQKIEKIKISKKDKDDKLSNNEKEKNDDNKKQKIIIISVKNEEKEKNVNNVTTKSKFDTKSNNTINSENKIKFDGNSEIDREKENENYMNQEEKENNDNIQEEKAEEKKIEEEKLFHLDKYGFCVFSIGSLLGIFIGAIKIPLSKEGFQGSTFSLTTTGGVLLTCLILGHIGKIKKLSLKVDKNVLENMIELGLILFLLGSGIAGGTKFVEYFKVIYFFYGILIL